MARYIQGLLRPMRSIVPCERLRCTGACLDDFEDVIFLRRKIVDGMAPEYEPMVGPAEFVVPLKRS